MADDMYEDDFDIDEVEDEDIASPPKYGKPAAAAPAGEVDDMLSDFDKVSS